MARITKKEKSDGLYRAILTLRTEEEEIGRAHV